MIIFSFSFKKQMNYLKEKRLKRESDIFESTRPKKNSFLSQIV